jgi:hypothetical protein
MAQESNFLKNKIHLSCTEQKFNVRSTLLSSSYLFPEQPTWSPNHLECKSILKIESHIIQSLPIIIVNGCYQFS